MRSVTVLIKPASSLCNMNCRYCFYADVSRHREIRSYGIMEEDTLELLIRRALSFAEESCNFVFQGGEPTLAGLGFFRKAIDLQKKYGAGIRISNSIQTNALAIDDDWAEFLAQNRFLTGVSLDGSRELHDRFRIDRSGAGTYDRILKNISLLEKHGAEFNILCVVNKYTAQRPEEVYSSLKKYRYIQFIPMIDDFEGGCEFSLTTENYAYFLKKVFDLYASDFFSGKYVSIRDFDDYISILCGREPSTCAMTGHCGGYFTAEADGSIYPCDFYVTDEWRLGNIKDSSFHSLAKSEKAKEFISSSFCTDEKCRACRWLPLCRGGCRRQREPFPSLNRFCGAYSEFFEHSYFTMSRIAREVMTRRR